MSPELEIKKKPWPYLFFILLPLHGQWHLAINLQNCLFDKYTLNWYDCFMGQKSISTAWKERAIYQYYGQNLLENWVSKQSFFVLILTMAKKYFFRNKTFLFFKIEGWNFQAVVNIKTKKLCLLTQFSRRFWLRLHKTFDPIVPLFCLTRISIEA